MSATNGYPFLTKKAIAERIRTDREYALEMFRLLLARTEERAADTRGASGFMASHAGKVRELVATLEERPLNDGEHLKLVTLVGHYTKQLASHFRTIELQTRPELLQVASVFSAIPGVARARSEGDVDEDAAETADDDAASAGVAQSPAVDAPTPRRRGRPKGSKNRPKEERKRGGRRR